MRRLVSLHPDLDYVLIHATTSIGEINLLLAKALHEQAMERYGVDDYKIIGQCQGHSLENQLLQHPFYKRQVPIILGDHVTTDAGTGAYHGGYLGGGKVGQTRSRGVPSAVTRRGSV